MSDRMLDKPVVDEHLKGEQARKFQSFAELYVQKELFKEPYRDFQHVDVSMSPKHAQALANGLDEDYKRAMRGDKHEQDFIKSLVKEWHDLRPDAPARDYLNTAIGFLYLKDPQAGALINKGMIEGDGSIKFN